MEWLARLYARRIVNINVNILLAGALAIGFMYGVMFYVHRWEIDAQIARKTQVDVKYVNMALSFVLDLVADLAVYYLLHWYANHAPSRYGKLIHPEYADLSFMQDATKVQIERIVLAPILYAVAMGMQYKMLEDGYRPPVAASISFAAGILLSRTLHTVWMIYDQRKRRRRMELIAGAGAAPPADPGTRGPAQ
ncbi:MAG TPA: hypothetical protein VD971_01505 [Phycisphaerales bacterium]|nr:hypothetical protein [Phycisphaerales bacterium]